MYTEYQPCGLLSAYIDKYWVFKGKTELGTYFKILPDGCCDFIFSIGDTAQCVGTNQPVMQPYRCFFVGSDDYFLELVTNTRAFTCWESVSILAVNRFLQTASL